MWGIKVEHINKIYIAVYSETDIKDDCMSALATTNMMCRNFEWYAIEHVYFTVHIEGKILQDTVLADVLQDVKDILETNYGKNSLSRTEDVYIHEIYETIYSTGYFEIGTGAYFSVNIAGNYEKDKIYQMVSLDFDSSIFDIGYLS